MPRPRKPASPFQCFNLPPEVIRLVVMMYVRFPLSLRNAEDLGLVAGCRHFGSRVAADATVGSRLGHLT
jgi:hypothetical protein